MRTIKGPALLLSRFFGQEPPFDRLDTYAAWAAGLGFQGVQVPSRGYLDVERAAESQDYCDEVLGILAECGLALTDLTSHGIGHLVAANPAYDRAFDQLVPAELRGRPAARQEWAVHHLRCCARASRRLGLAAHGTFSGNLVWPYLYPGLWRPAGIVEEGFAELARRWRPILDAFDAEGVDVCYEVHPGEDVHDGASFERFRDAVDRHPRCNILYDPSHFVLQQLDYLAYIDLYYPFIRMMHVKDAEFRPSGRQGVYGGYEPWIDRAGRFRSVGDGQVDFGAILSKLKQYGYPGWAVLEWECCLKHPEDGAREGAEFIRRHLIRVTDREFPSSSGTPDATANRGDLGLDRPGIATPTAGQV